jgi:hypothetical protein
MVMNCLRFIQFFSVDFIYTEHSYHKRESPHLQQTCTVYVNEMLGKERDLNADKDRYIYIYIYIYIYSTKHSDTEQRREGITKIGSTCG